MLTPAPTKTHGAAGHQRCHLEERADVALYIKTLAGFPGHRQLQYHAAYSNPDLVNQLRAARHQTAVLDREHPGRAVRSLPCPWPLTALSQ